MEVIDLINKLEDLVDNTSARPKFFGGGININRNDILDILDSIRNQLPDEIKQAKWIKDERTKILNDAEYEANARIDKAQKEIDEMLHNTKIEAQRLISEHEITLKSIEYSKAIVDKANSMSEEIKNGARVYVEKIMNELQKDINDYSEALSSNRLQLNSFIDKSIENDVNSLQNYKDRVDGILK